MGTVTLPHSNLPPEPSGDVPADLQARLQRLYASRSAAPALAASLVEAAGTQIAARRRWRRVRRAGVAIAAVLALAGGALVLWSPWGSPGGAGALVAARDPMDLNADGSVDMLDALAARIALDAGRPVNVDVSGEGGGVTTDTSPSLAGRALAPAASQPAAVVAIARRAVRLPAAAPAPGGEVGNGGPA